MRELGMKKHWDNDLKEEIKALAEESAVLIQQISWNIWEDENESYFEMK